MWLNGHRYLGYFCLSNHTHTHAYIRIYIYIHMHNSFGTKSHILSIIKHPASEEVDRWATDDIVKRAVEKPLASEAERQEYAAWKNGEPWEMFMVFPWFPYGFLLVSPYPVGIIIHVCNVELKMNNRGYGSNSKLVSQNKLARIASDIGCRHSFSYSVGLPFPSPTPRGKAGAPWAQLCG